MRKTNNYVPTHIAFHAMTKFLRLIVTNLNSSGKELLRKNCLSCKYIRYLDSEAETLIDASDTPSRNDRSHSCKNGLKDILIKKYTCNDIYHCRALSEFLSGHQLEAYKTLGGSEQKCVEMKLELHKQYDTLKRKTTRQWQTEFYNTKIKDDETIVLYGARPK